MDTKKQHFVPQLYLKGFAFGEQAWAVRKGPTGRFERLFQARVGDLCAKRYYHEVKVSHVGSPGDLAIRNRIEKLLSKKEHDLADPLRDETSARNVRALKTATAENLGSMKILLAHMIVRNPVNLDPSRKESEKLFKVLIDKAMISHEELPLFEGIGLTPGELIEHSIMYAELLATSEGSSMHSILSWLDGAGAIVLRARAGAQFITADTPFAMSWSSDESDLPVYIYFPLDCRTAVIFHTHGKELTSHIANAKVVALWNQILMRWHRDTRTVIGKSERALRLAVDEYAGSS